MNDALVPEQQIDDVRDRVEIRRLAEKFARYVNARWGRETVDFEDLRNVFAKHATWACGSIGVDVVGQSEIIQALREKTSSGEFAMHIFLNPIVDLDGDVANGKWVLWVAGQSSGQLDERLQGEHVRYVRNKDGWRIQSINLLIRGASPMCKRTPRA